MYSTLCCCYLLPTPQCALCSLVPFSVQSTVYCVLSCLVSNVQHSAVRSLDLRFVAICCRHLCEVCSSLINATSVKEHFQTIRLWTSTREQPWSALLLSVANTSILSSVHFSSTMHCAYYALHSVEVWLCLVFSEMPWFCCYLLTTSQHAVQ